MTAKFAAGEPLFYVTFTNEKFAASGGVNAGKLFYYYTGEEVPIYVQSENVLSYAVYSMDGYEDLSIVENDGFNFLGWYNSTGKLISTSKDLSGREIYDAQIPKGATISAAFRNENGSDPNQTYTITIDYGIWHNDRWLHEDNYGKIGFSATSLSYYSQNIQAKLGESITIYAEGSYGNDNGSDWWYGIKGFYSENHTPYKSYSTPVSTTEAQYTFTVTGNRTIYVEFEYFYR